MKALIVKTSSMGDVIHALATAHDLRAAMPDLDIHWAAEESFREIPTLSPAVGRVHVCAFRRWRKAPLSRETRAEVRALREELAAERFDAVLDIQGLIKSAVLASWTKVPVTGFTWGTAREPLASLFYTRKLNLPASLGAVRRSRMAAAETFGYAIDEAHPVFGLRTTAEPSLRVGGPYAALAVNTSRDSKLWPEANWVELGGWLLRERGLRSVFFWGSDKEHERVSRLASQIEGALIAPRCGLAATAATMAGASAMVGVDTGLAHLAAALGVPSVGLYVSTPINLLRLVGDGPVRSLGGEGLCPSVDEVRRAFDQVIGEKA
ncbi:MAG: Lipopolysaccharide heptosyltransferase I [Burkholderia sp.]